MYCRKKPVTALSHMSKKDAGKHHPHPPLLLERLASKSRWDLLCVDDKEAIPNSIKDAYMRPFIAHTPRVGG